MHLCVRVRVAVNWQVFYCYFSTVSKEKKIAIVFLVGPNYIIAKKLETRNFLKCFCSDLLTPQFDSVSLTFWKLKDFVVKN